MQNASYDQRVAIWSRIVSFAVTMENPALDKSACSALVLDWRYSFNYTCSWFDRRFLDISAARLLLIVSHDVYEALLLTLSRHLDLGHDTSIVRWADLLHNRTALASQTETLVLNPRPGDPSLDMLFQNCSRLRSLELGILSPYSMGAVGGVGTLIGSTLRTLTLSGQLTRKTEDWMTATFSSDAFSGFVALEHLEMSAYAPRFLPTSSCNFLPNLRHIKVWNAHRSFFTMLSGFGLPKLQQFTIRKTVRDADGFIITHGPKLVRVTTTLGWNQTNLDSCPNMEVLELLDDNRPVFAELAHPHLRQLRLTWKGSRLISKYKQFCDTISPERFPALRDIFVAPGLEIWPSKEREVCKSSWPPMAVKLAAQGIVLRDQSGGTWRPRLKPQ